MIKDDCFFLMPFLCVCLFMFIGQSETRSFTVDTRTMRSLSVIIYCSHDSIAGLILKIFRLMGIKEESGFNIFLLFLCTMAVTLMVAYIFLLLENRKSLRWLKYSH